jgi:hypothetical protein
MLARERLLAGYAVNGMKKQIIAYFTYWLDTYRVPKERRERFFKILGELFEEFDAISGQQITIEWKIQRKVSSNDD